MKKIAIIVITYRRPAGLRKVLAGLSSQRYPDQKQPPELLAIVVDNDVNASASVTVDSVRNDSSLVIKYIHEPTQGIPIARNSGLAAVPEDFDYLCFIDDDEWPGDTWINELLKTRDINNADCVLGAVIPVYPKAAPQWLVKSKVFDSWKFADNQRINQAASNNVLITTAFLRQHQHTFDERMRMSGGSDFLFFKQANAMGMKIYWSDNAPVYEEVPLSRMTFRWLTQRQYRLGNTFSFAERLAGTKIGLLTLVLKGLMRVVLGILMMPSIVFSPYFGMKAISHILRGSGMFAGAFGHTHQEYSPKGLIKDRASKK